MKPTRQQGFLFSTLVIYKTVCKGSQWALFVRTVVHVHDHGVPREHSWVYGKNLIFEI